MSRAVKFCQANTYFHASSVFLAISDGRSQHCDVVIISDNHRDQESWQTIDSDENCTLKIYSEEEIYRKILSRDIEIVTIFSHAIPLLDNINIIPRILSSIEPIKLYNQQIMKSIENANIVCRETEFSLLFCDIEDIQQFISKTFIPLCTIIKEYLSDVQYWIDWQYGNRNINRNVLLTFIVKSSYREAIIRKLQLYLYKNVSELQLHRIQLPFERTQNYIDRLPTVVREKTYDALCHLTEEFFASFSLENINDNKKIAIATYYYLVAAKSYFSSKTEFINVNKMLIDTMTDESISPSTKYLLNHDIIIGAKDKILREYKYQSDKNKATLFVNYASLIIDWSSMPDENDVLHESLFSLIEIHNCIDAISSLNNDSLPLYFIAFYERLANCMDLPPFYKAYIPYCINYLQDYEV